MNIGSATLNPGTVTISSVTAKIQDSAGNDLTSTTSALDVNVKNASLPVTGTFWQATQPVSLAAETTKVIGVARVADGSGNLLTSTTNALDVNIKSSDLTSLTTGTGIRDVNTLRVTVATDDSVPVTGTFYQATQPVSATNLDIRDLTSASDSVAAVCTNAGTFAVQATLAAETTKVIGVARIADGSGNLLGSTSNALDVNIKSSDLTSLTTGTGIRDANTLRVTVATDDSVPVTNTGTFAVQSTNQANSGVDIGDVTINNSTGAAAVNIQDGGNTITVDNGGTFAVQASQSTASNLNAQVVGSIADDATTPGNPVMIGGMAVETDGTDPTSVSAEGDAAIVRTDRNRRLLVNDVHPRLWTANTTETSAQTDKELVAAPGASLSLYITDIVVSNGATAGTVLFEEDTASAKTVKVPKLYLAINGGAVMNFRTPIRITANKNFGFTSATVTTHDILVNGYIAP